MLTPWPEFALVGPQALHPDCGEVVGGVAALMASNLDMGGLRMLASCHETDTGGGTDGHAQSCASVRPLVLLWTCLRLRKTEGGDVVAMVKP